MKFEQYVPLAVKTESAKNPFSDEFILSSGMNVRMFHAILGMATEVEEMLEASDSVNLLEECGDFCWYQAIYESAVPGTIVFNKIDLTLPIDLLVKELRINTAKMLDHTKKVLMYGKAFDSVMIARIMNTCFLLVNNLIISTGGTLCGVRQINIDKLSARYPDKFTDYHAENRDLEKERSILAGGLS